jgi:hypothetical protein
VIAGGSPHTTICSRSAKTRPLLRRCVKCITAFVFITARRSPRKRKKQTKSRPSSFGNQRAGDHLNVSLYTAWYPNDGPELKEVGERFAEQEISVSDVALWESRSMTWSATDISPGRYYFVVLVDSESEIGAYRVHRSEFSV